VSPLRKIGLLSRVYALTWRNAIVPAHRRAALCAIARCRELLAEEADGLSDHDIDRISQHADAMARVIVEAFLEQRAAQE
jgi:hypothetical protein